MKVRWAGRQAGGAILSAVIAVVAVLAAFPLVGGSRASDGASPIIADITWERPTTSPVADITWEKPISGGLVADITWELRLDPIRPHV